LAARRVSINAARISFAPTSSHPFHVVGAVVGVLAAHHLGHSDEQMAALVVALAVAGLDDEYRVEAGQRGQVQLGQRGGQPGRWPPAAGAWS